MTPKVHASGLAPGVSKAVPPPSGRRQRRACGRLGAGKPPIEGGTTAESPGTVILGSGLAGLSAAVRHPGALVFEATGAAGGLCSSSVVDGFTFDRAGHLWHLADARVRRTVEAWLGGPLRGHRRRAGVLFRGRLLPYPVQLALGRMPADAAAAAGAGLEQVRVGARPAAGETFEEACLRRYGEGLTRLFLAPYQAKLLGRAPREVLAEPFGRFLPDLSVEAMLASLDGDVGYAGYNATFRDVPGGCGRVGDALAAATPGLRLESPVSSLDCGDRAVTAGGTTLRYERLVATLPLPALASLTVDLPAALRETAARLRGAAVVVVNLGVAGPPANGLHWVYVPEPAFPFYRVGSYSSFAPEAAPPGCHSLYVELPAGWWDARPQAVRVPLVLSALERSGLLGDSRRVVAAEVVRLDPAYAVLTAESAPVREALLAWYGARGVVLHGRFARWDYLAMDDVVAASLVM